jgi:NAD(P)-dependent dehydrogenase (short-subunit alcohol dehydrogenase family)
VDLELEGKVAVVTGASRGIGLAVLMGLIAEGVKVVAGARDVTSLEGLDVVAVPVDLSTADGPGRLVEAAVEAHGGLDFLINNAGGGRLHFDGFASIGDEDWMWSFQTNLMSGVRMVRAALPHLLEREGAIVNVSSLNARIPAVEAPEYSAMKAALGSVSRALAVELAPRGVRVNAVSPGPVLTDMQTGPGGVAEQVAAVSGGTIEDYVAGVEQAVPLRRFATPEEIAAIVITLLSRRAGYVTGADIAVDGATGQG